MLIDSNKLGTKKMINHIRLPIFLLSFIFIFSGCVPTKPFQPTEIHDVREISGLTKGQIYSKARQWFSQYFVSGESVIDYENSDEAIIIGNGIANIGTSFLILESIKYNIKIEAKDGKFRASTTIIEHRNTDSNNTYNASYGVGEERMNNGNKKIAEIVSSLESYIKATNKSEW